MLAIAYGVMVLGALLTLLGVMLMVFPIAGVPLMAIGGFIVWAGQLLRRKAREQSINRQMGG